jgi:clan AA aspartic protease
VGTFKTSLSISDRSGSRWEQLDAFVDTGASYTLVSSQILSRLGLVPTIRTQFELADGRRVEYGMTETRVRLNGDERTTLVIFGDEDADSLLGAYTLEGFGLAPDPVGRRLIPVPGILK